MVTLRPSSQPKKAALPALGSLSRAERRFLLITLNRLRALGGMVLGLYAEAVVTEALPGAVQSVSGTDRVDLIWADREIQVKTTRGSTWKVPAPVAKLRGKRVVQPHAEVYVLAHHHGESHRTGWRFHVVPGAWLDEHGRQTVSMAAVTAWGAKPVGPRRLAEQVRWAAPR
jgi:hypothetical protein